MEMSVPLGETSTREGQDCTPTAENICMSRSFTTGCWMRYRAMASRMLALSFSFSNLWEWDSWGLDTIGGASDRSTVHTRFFIFLCATHLAECTPTTTKGSSLYLRSRSASFGRTCMQLLSVVFVLILRV